MTVHTQVTLWFRQQQGSWSWWLLWPVNLPVGSSTLSTLRLPFAAWEKSDVGLTSGSDFHTALRHGAVSLKAPSTSLSLPTRCHFFFLPREALSAGSICCHTELIVGLRRHLNGIKMVSLFCPMLCISWVYCKLGRQEICCHFL